MCYAHVMRESNNKNVSYGGGEKEKQSHMNKSGKVQKFTKGCIYKHQRETASYINYSLKRGKKKHQENSRGGESERERERGRGEVGER